MKFVFIALLGFNVAPMLSQAVIFDGENNQSSGPVVLVKTEEDTIVSDLDYDAFSFIEDRIDLVGVQGVSKHTIKVFQDDDFYYQAGGVGGLFEGYHGLVAVGNGGMAIQAYNNSGPPTIRATNEVGNAIQASSKSVGSTISVSNSVGKAIDCTSTNDFALNARSILGEAVRIESFTSRGAIISGGNGIAIELKTNNSIYGVDNDDAVIITDDKEGSDLIVVANDAIAFHLDDDKNSTSSFVVKNGVDSDIFTLDETGNLTITGTLSQSSDIKRKHQFQEVELNDVLQKVNALPITTWKYKGENITHMGPIAQEFYEQFGLGASEKSISAIDADGVALAAIKALSIRNKEQQKEIEELKKLVQGLSAQVNALTK